MSLKMRDKMEGLKDEMREVAMKPEWSKQFARRYRLSYPLLRHYIRVIYKERKERKDNS